MSPERNGSQKAATDRTAGAHSATVNLPFVTARFHAPTMPHVRPPSRDELTAAVRAVRSFLPSTKQVVYFGGLALAAAFEVIEWPVAAAIGIGTALAGREERRETTERKDSTGSEKKRTTSTARRTGSA